jgi:hypothetical protein
MLVANENLEMSRKTRKWVGNFQVISTPISHPNPAFPTHFLFLVRCVGKGCIKKIPLIALFENAKRALWGIRGSLYFWIIFQFFHHRMHNKKARSRIWTYVQYEQHQWSWTFNREEYYMYSVSTNPRDDFWARASCRRVRAIKTSCAERRVPKRKEEWSYCNFLSLKGGIPLLRVVRRSEEMG